MTNKKTIDSVDNKENTLNETQKESKKPISKIPKNTYSHSKSDLWKRVVDDVLFHFGIIDANGVPAFKSITLYPSDYGVNEFTYGFARKLCDEFDELDYYTDIECDDFKVKSVIIGIEPIIDKWDF